MLIYEKKGGQLYITQVMIGAGKSHVSTHKTDIDRIHASHRDPVEYLQEGLVFVTGDSSVLGGGVQPRSRYAHYLDKDNK